MNHYSEKELRSFYTRELPESEEEPIREHLKGCDECKKTLKRLLFFDRMIEKYFNEREKTCLPVETLFDYVYEVLDEARVPEVEKHIKDCAICSVLVKGIESGYAAETDRGREMLPSISLNPEFAEMVCKDFVKQRLPGEAKWSNLVWEALTSTLRDLRNLSLEEWVIVRKGNIANALGLASTDSLDLISPSAMLVIWGTFEELRKRASFDEREVIHTAGKLANLLSVPSTIRGEIVSYLDGLFGTLKR